MIQYRHGDVFLTKIDNLPDGCVTDEDNPRVLADGEVTGHRHRVNAGQVLLPRVVPELDGRPRAEGNAPLKYLDAPEGATLTHEEHGPIVIVPGIYEVRIQREYTPQAIRQVVD